MATPGGKPITGEQQDNAWAAYQAAPRGAWFASGAKAQVKKDAAAKKVADSDHLAAVVAGINDGTIKPGLDES